MAALLVFFAEDLGHGGFGVVELFGGGEAGFFGAGGENLAGDARHGGMLPGIVGGEGGDLGVMDAHAGGGGDGVLARS